MNHEQFAEMVVIDGDVEITRDEANDLLTEFGDLQARVDDLTGQVAGRDEQIAVRDGHAECPNAANEGWCPWCRIAEQTEQIEQLQATLNVRDGQLTASRRQVAGRDQTIQRVRELHAPEDQGTGELLCQGCATHVTYTPWAKCKTIRAIGGGLYPLDGDPADDGRPSDA